MLKSFGELALIQKLKITWYEQTWRIYWVLVISISKNPTKFTIAYKTKLTNPQLINFTWWVIRIPKVIIQIGNNYCSCTWLFRDAYPLISILKQLGKKNHTLVRKAKEIRGNKHSNHQYRIALKQEEQGKGFKF